MQGDILQVFTHPTEPRARFRWIGCFDDKLLARYQYRTEVTCPGSGTRMIRSGMLALKGL
jgi:hypothetical protein